MGDNRLLFAVDDEIAALVVAALAHVESHFAWHSRQDTEVGLDHNGETAQQHFVDGEVGRLDIGAFHGLLDVCVLAYCDGFLGALA